MSLKSSTNRSGTSKPGANADSSPSRTMAVGHDAADRLAEHGHEAEPGRERQLARRCGRGRCRGSRATPPAAGAARPGRSRRAAHRVADDHRPAHAELVERRAHPPRLLLHRRSRRAASRSRRGRAGRTRSRGGRAPAPATMSSHQPIEQAKPCSSTMLGASGGPSSRTWRSPPGQVDDPARRPPWPPSVSRSITTVFTREQRRRGADEQAEEDAAHGRNAIRSGGEPLARTPRARRRARWP